MTTLILALVPLAFVTGCLVWLMTSGAEAQAESDAWAEQWVKDNQNTSGHGH
jgi:hypothetical protein